MKIGNYLLVAGMIMLGIPTVTLSAHAHGATKFPPARQYTCWVIQQTGKLPDGTDPDQATRQLCLRVASSALSNWQGYLFNVKPPRADAVSKIPDDEPSHLCSGTRADNDIINDPLEWHRTRIAAPNGTFRLIYRAPAGHDEVLDQRSFFDVYLTTPEYDSTKRLKLTDLTLLHRYERGEFVDVPYEDVPPFTKYYERQWELEINLPPGRNGDAILYTRWQRLDPEGEGFYSCSDVTIVGNGSPGFDWRDRGKFIAQDPGVKPDDQMLFWMESARGPDPIKVFQDIRVDNQNVSAWAKELAGKLNIAAYVNLLRIGKRSGNAIVYDETDVGTNSVWLKSANQPWYLDPIRDGNNPPPRAYVEPATQTVRALRAYT